MANHSKAYVNAVVDVHLPYEEDLGRVRSLLLAVTGRVLEEQRAARGPVEVKVQELSEGSVLLRVIAQVPPGKDEDMGDELRACIVEEMRAAGIGAPRARRAVLIDSTVRVGSPSEAEKEGEEGAGPPAPFSPPNAD